MGEHTAASAGEAVGIDMTMTKVVDTDNSLAVPAGETLVAVARIENLLAAF